MALAGLSTLGVLLGYGVEATAGTKPTSFKQLDRINAIGGISGESETIDASALEDLMERSVAGRQSSGGSVPITINVTDETMTQCETMISAYKSAATANKRLWLEVYHPSMTKAWFIVAQPPQVLPMPAFDQNGLLTVELTFAIEEYIGRETAIKPTAQSAA